MALHVAQLLQEIQQIVGCPYLSDLRHASHTELSELIKRALFEIPDEAYTIEEWAQAISYLKGECRTAANIKEIKNFF